MKPYYDSGGITIYHGDCREILPTFPAGVAQCAVTSPPYNLLRNHQDSEGPNSIYKTMSAKFREGWYDDHIPEPEYQVGQRKLLEELLRITDGSVFYNHKVRHAMKRMHRVVHPMEWISGLPLWCEIIWDRGGGVAVNSRRFVHSDERIFQFGYPKRWHDLGLTTVWRLSPAHSDLDHPCPFPLELASRCIAATTDPGDTVLDPYLGSGTVLRAAKNLGRKAIGIEIEERYCEIAAKRLSQEILPL